LVHGDRSMTETGSTWVLPTWWRVHGRRRSRPLIVVSLPTQTTAWRTGIFRLATARLGTRTRHCSTRNSSTGRSSRVLLPGRVPAHTNRRKVWTGGRCAATKGPELLLSWWVCPTDGASSCWSGAPVDTGRTDKRIFHRETARRPIHAASWFD